MVYQNALLIDSQTAVVYLADADTANEFIVINGADQYLGICIRVALRSRDRIDDRLKERTHIHFRVIQLAFCKAGPCRSKHKRTVKLFIGCIQIHHKL